MVGNPKRSIDREGEAESPNKRANINLNMTHTLVEATDVNKASPNEGQGAKETKNRLDLR